MPDNNYEDYDMNDIIIQDLARHIEEGGVLNEHYLYHEQTDLFEYEEKLDVDTSKIGIDIAEKLSDNGK